MTWQPLVDGRRAREAMRMALEIADALEATLAGPVGELSLRSGTAGHALVFHYLAQHAPGERFAELASSAFEQIVERMPSVVLSPSFHDGFAGIAWVGAHLGEAADDEPDDDPDPIDAALESLLAAETPEGAHELGLGLAGFGVYARERLPRPVARRQLTRIIDELARLAIRSDGRACWRTLALRPEDRARYPLGWYNLGIAHGAGGVIGLLALTPGHDSARDALLRDAVAWLLDQQLLAARSAFPYTVGSNVDAQPAGVGWCYGDLGLATVLLAAAERLKDRRWRDQAIALAVRAAERDDDLARVRNAGLCHGAAGMAHMFNRMFQRTGEAVFARATQTWLARALAMDRPKELGWLDGAAGLALGLLAAATAVEPCWDRAMLLS